MRSKKTRLNHSYPKNSMNTNHWHHFGITVIALLSLSSCASPYAGPNQSIGSVLGAATGAIAGAVIGNQTGRPLEGAAIGGAIGGVAGAALGSAQDDYQYGRYPAPAYESPPRVYAAPVPVYPRRYYSYNYDYCPPPQPYYGRPYYRRGNCW